MAKKANGSGKKTNGHNPVAGDTPSPKLPAVQPRRHPGGPFVQGNQVAIGNRGRKAGRFLTQALIAELHEIDPLTNMNKFRKVVRNLVDLASEAKELAAITEIFNRVEGKALQAVELSTRGTLAVIDENTTLGDAARIYAQALKHAEDETIEGDYEEVKEDEKVE